MGTPFVWMGRAGRAGRVRAGQRNLLTRRPARQRTPSTRPGRRRSVTSLHAACRCRRGRLGTQRTGRRADPGPGRSRGRGLRGGADSRGRDPHAGAHPRRLPSRRVLGGAPGAGGLTLLPLARPGRPRDRAASARGGLRPSARRWAGRRAVPGRRRDGLAPRRGRHGLPGPGGALGGLAGPHRALRPGPDAPPPARPVGSRPLRVRGDAVGAAHGTPLQHRCGPGPAGRDGGARHGTAHGPLDLGLRPPAHGTGARRRLARRRGRERGHHEGIGERAAPPRRRGAHRQPGHRTGRAPAGPRRPARHLAAGFRRVGRGAALPPGRSAVGAVQTRARAPARWTGRSTVRCPGQPRPAGAR